MKLIDQTSSVKTKSKGFTTEKYEQVVYIIQKAFANKGVKRFKGGKKNV